MSREPIVMPDAPPSFVYIGGVVRLPLFRTAGRWGNHPSFMFSASRQELLDVLQLDTISGWSAPAVAFWDSGAATGRVEAVGYKPMWSSYDRVWIRIAFPSPLYPLEPLNL